MNVWCACGRTLFISIFMISYYIWCRKNGHTYETADQWHTFCCCCGGVRHMPIDLIHVNFRCIWLWQKWHHFVAFTVSKHRRKFPLWINDVCAAYMGVWRTVFLWTDSRNALIVCVHKRDRFHTNIENRPQRLLDLSNEAQTSEVAFVLQFERKESTILVA